MSKKLGAAATAVFAATTLAATEARPAAAQIGVYVGPRVVEPYAAYSPYLRFDPYCPGEVGVEVPGYGVECEYSPWGFGAGFGLWPEFRGWAYGGGFGRPGFDHFYGREFEGRGGFGRGGFREHEFAGAHPGAFSHGGQYQPGNRDQHYTVQHGGGAPAGGGFHGGGGGAPHGGGGGFHGGGGHGPGGHR